MTRRARPARRYRHWVWLTLLWWALSALPGQAGGFDPEQMLRLPHRTLRLHFKTWPPNAEVFLLDGQGGSTKVGEADDGVMDTNINVSIVPEPLNLQVTRDGYKAEALTIPPGEQREGQAIPRTVNLHAYNPLVDLITWVKYHPLITTLVLVALAAFSTLYAGPKLRRLRLRLKRAAHLENLIASDEERDHLSGKKLGTYRVCGRIAEGGMAFVYRAVPDDTLAPSESVAIKVMKPELFSDGEVKERFRREVLILRKLNHPLVARILDWGEQKKLLYMVTELVRGETLRGKIPDSGMSPAEAMKLMAPVFEAVSHLHSKGVVHRNLKPENILVQNNGKIKVIDFGLARGIGSSRLTGNGVVLGTPAYMAPEQVKGEESDPRTDQYALGILMYELLTGKKPFRANNKMTIMHMQVTDKPATMSEVKEGIPAGMDAVVQRMLAKDPKERYPTVEDAWKDITRSAGGGSGAKVGATA
ncbi:MAG TPA: serine/threonine-protein kinase [Candidatus Xenobia bacterium]|jgi:serine/threonine-protein kinase